VSIKENKIKKRYSIKKNKTEKLKEIRNKKRKKKKREIKERKETKNVTIKIINIDKRLNKWLNCLKYIKA